MLDKHFLCNEGLLIESVCQVRSSAADYMFTVTESEVIKYEDWSAHPSQLKEKMERVKAVLAIK